ncbi:MAG: amidohydrolase family protein [Synergistales bacterium]|nr:amidohydrolase family protein [Synergistales bacterium]
MQQADLLLKGGTLIDPVGGEERRTALAVRNGLILGEGDPSSFAAAKEMDITGRYVLPGFIDTHMHDEELDDPATTELALLRQGVTTAVAGNCGTGPRQETVRAHRRHPWLEIGYLTGHWALRDSIGLTDVHRAASPQQLEEMQRILAAELREGSLGLSFGLEYVPETSPEEVRALVEVLRDFTHRLVSIHIRYDGPRCLEGVEEAVDLARSTGVRVQISHFGSMNAFGHLPESLELVDRAHDEGVDVTFDCYPYDAFCTYAGTTVFDPGFRERWNKDYGDLEAASGTYVGRRLTRESFDDIRANSPGELIIAHVMNESEVLTCLQHPRCAIASDATLHRGEGHPRAAGTFPRALRRLREEGLSWPDAVRHATSLPAHMAWFDDRGNLEAGNRADLVVVDPQHLRDRATFADQLAPPEGIDCVILGGEIAVEHNTATEPLGRLLTRREDGSPAERRNSE